MSGKYADGDFCGEEDAEMELLAREEEEYREWCRRELLGGPDGMHLVEQRTIRSLAETIWIRPNGHAIRVPCKQKYCDRCGEALLPGTSCTELVYADRWNFYHFFVCDRCNNQWGEW